ncbi:MAG: tetratricopeptide repeat protein [Xanthomonadales bacterium]|nr:tetratricopeptide repeat protein [Xanthomonadales bacterium]
MRQFLTELKRRNVFKVGVLYLISGWLVLQVGDVVFSVIGLPDWTLKLVVAILGLGFPIVLVFSWIYEVTPEGIKREKDVDRSQSITSQTGQKVNIAIGFGLAVAIGLMVYDRIFPPEPTRIEQLDRAVAAPAVAEAAMAPTVEPSIAVLPFVNMSTSADQAFFADGLSDTMMLLLSQVQGLKVAARTSSFSFKGKDKTVQEIAEVLSVNTVLEGSVQRAGDRVRVIAQLVDAASGTHLWSANFDRELKDIFAVQDEIAQEVVAALKLTLLDEDEAQLTERYEPSLEAYEQVILGRQGIEKRTADSLAEAEQHFKRAIELDPDYALAYSGLADTYYLKRSYAGLSFEESLRLREPLAQKAVGLDPLSGEARTSLATVLYEQGDVAGAEQAFLRAIELNPSNANALHWYSSFLAFERRLNDRALEVGRRAFELDPLSPIIRANYAGRLEDVGRIEEAVFLLREGIEQSPDFANFYNSMVAIRSDQGRLGEARRWNDEAMRLSPGQIRLKGRDCLLQFQLLEHEAATECARGLRERWPEKIEAAITASELYFRNGAYAKSLEFTNQLRERIAHIDAYRRIIDGVVAWTHLQLREPESGKAALQNSYPELYGDTGPEVDDSNWEPAIHAGWFELQLGRPERADALFDGVEKVLSARHRTRGQSYDVADVRIFAARGQKELALEKLREAIDAGWREDWHFHLRRDVMLESLWDDPEFIAMAKEVEADMIAQREWYEEHKDTPIAQL